MTKPMSFKTNVDNIIKNNVEVIIMGPRFDILFKTLFLNSIL